MFYIEDRDGNVVAPEEVEHQFNHLILKESVPADLLKLLSNLTQRTSVQLFATINKYLRNVTSGESSFVLYYDQQVKEAGITVIGEHVLQSDIRLAYDVSLIGTLKGSDESVIIDARCLPEQLVQEINTDLFNHKHSGDLREVLFIPIYCPGEGQPVFWVGLANSTQLREVARRDESLVSECFRYCVALIKNALRYEEMRQHHSYLKLLITAIWESAKKMDDINVLSETLKRKACEIFSCESCSIYLKEDRNLVSRTTKYGAPFDFNNRGLYDIVIPVGLGHIGSVGATGDTQNTANIRQPGPIDFCNALDKYSEQETRNILAFAMPFKDNKVFGVIELANKLIRRHFTKVDNMYAALFGKISGAFLYHSLHLRKTSANYENKEIVNSFLLRHMKLKNKEVHNVFRIVDIPDLETYSTPTCFPSSTNEDDTILVILNMFSELEFVSHYGIPPTKLLRFVLNVKKSHNVLPFFNWFHTFSCFQFTYMLISGHQIMEKEYLLEIEVFAMFIAVLCHHMDHLGTLSCFQLSSGNVLESLYSSPGQISRHHTIGQTFRLINQPGCTILENVQEEQYKQILLLIDKMILATDLADHINRLRTYEDMIAKGFSYELGEDREVLYQLMLGCIEMNDYARPWKHLREVGPKIFNEFLRQNEEPNAEGVFNFPDLNYRPKMAECHSLFLTDTVLPSFDKLAKLIPSTISFVSLIKLNLDAWQTVRNKLKKEKAENIMDILMTEIELTEEPAVAPTHVEVEEDDQSENDD